MLESGKFYSKAFYHFSMSLTAGKQIGRYEIISLLGSGGMGEVYLAKDKQLQRQVALKILKKTKDPECLRRFRQEARAASSLNHPTILSIYEFGEHEDFHFIVTELIKGETLRQIISEKRLNLKKAVEIAIQIGNTLVVAHGAGIIHRDIKPENIMVLPDGYVKVLDFGLAKLINTEELFLGNEQQSTISLLQTKPGLIIGTVNYMSPEQIRGQKVDERTDLWSLGIVLFEMIAGRRPFTGESISDVIAAILERPLPSLSDISSKIPLELENIIARSLAKNKEERYASAKDFVDDLRTFKQLLSGEISLNSQKTITLSIRNNEASSALNKSFSSSISQNVRSRWLRVSIIAVLIFIGLGGWFYFNQSPSRQITPKIRKSKSLSTSGNVLNAVLSPDGTYYVYVQDDNGKQSLRTRQINGNGESTLIPPDSVSYSGIRFSPDKDSIFYTIFKDLPTGQLYRIPTIGGKAQKITDDVDSPVTFSPDGKQFAFIRTNSHKGVDQIVISNIDGSNPSILYERKYPSRYSIASDVRESLAWSPDGKTIACAAGRQDDSGEKMTVVEIDVESRTEREITPLTWFRVGKVLWTKDGQDLIITAAEPGANLHQILRLSRSDGQIKERITTELNDYLNISFSADSKFLLAVADNRYCNLYTAASKNPNQTTQIAGGNLQGMGGLVWTREEKILYVSTENGNRDIWVMDSDGKNSYPLTTDRASDEYPSISADSKYITFVSSRTGNPHVWRMNADGSDPKLLTNKGGAAFPQIMPGGKSVIYTAIPLKIWKVSIEGGEPTQVTLTPANWIAVSPDGSKIAGIPMDSSGFRLSIFSALDGSEIKSFDLSVGFGSPGFPPIFRWMPDGKAIGYISTQNGVSNIVVQSLTGGEPNKLTDFPVDRIFAFDWSKDGSKIAFARGKADNKLILFEDF